MKSAIKRALATARRTSPVALDKLSKNLALITTQMEQGSALHGSLLGIEEASKTRVTDALEALHHGQAHLSRRVTLGSRYPELSMEPLTWRDQAGWPRLVVFGLDSPHFEIEAIHWIDETGWPRRTSQTAQFVPQTRRTERTSGARTIVKYEVRPLPGPVAACYADVLRKLEGMAAGREKTLKLSCSFQGVIPADVKQKIAKARGSFDDLFLIEEPKEFLVTESDAVILQPPLPKPASDPLIVGFDGSKLWLIADFDTTPVEEAMKFSLPGATKH